MGAAGIGMGFSWAAASLAGPARREQAAKSSRCLGNGGALISALMPSGTDWRTENTAGGILTVRSTDCRLACWQRGSAALIVGHAAREQAGIMRDAAPPIQASRTRKICAAVFGVVLAALVGTPTSKAAELSSAIAYLYSSVSIYPPSATSMTVCYGFVCRRREILDFTAGDRSALTQIMASGRASAAAERAAAQKAVVWFDRRMGPIIGTNKRVAKADFRYFDDKHNYDCWDTTRNTTSLLLVLQQWGLLKYHVVGDPHYRGNTLVLQTPHNTAVLVDRSTKVEWVVDLWPRGYLQPPDVMTVEKWVTED